MLRNWTSATGLIKKITSQVRSSTRDRNRNSCNGEGKLVHLAVVSLSPSFRKSLTRAKSGISQDLQNLAKPPATRQFQTGLHHLHSTLPRAITIDYTLTSRSYSYTSHHNVLPPTLPFSEARLAEQHHYPHRRRLPIRRTRS